MFLPWNLDSCDDRDARHQLDELPDAGRVEAGQQAGECDLRALCDADGAERVPAAVAPQSGIDRDF